MRAARARRGFTLVEIMIVVAIVGVLMTLGLSLLRSRPRPIDVAATLSARISEAARKAVTSGSVRPAVVDNLGIRYRTRVVITVADRGGWVSLERLEEHVGDDGADWVVLSTHQLDGAVRVVGTADTPALTGGAGPASSLPAGAIIELQCYADGRCVRAGTVDQGLTLYLAATKGPRQARVVVLPLGGAPVTFDTW